MKKLLSSMISKMMNKMYAHDGQNAVCSPGQYPVLCVYGGKPPNRGRYFGKERN